MYANERAHTLDNRSQTVNKRKQWNEHKQQQQTTTNAEYNGSEW